LAETQQVLLVKYSDKPVSYVYCTCEHGFRIILLMDDPRLTGQADNFVERTYTRYSSYGNKQLLRCPKLAPNPINQRFLIAIQLITYTVVNKFIRHKNKINRQSEKTTCIYA